MKLRTQYAEHEEAKGVRTKIGRAESSEHMLGRRIVVMDIENVVGGSVERSVIAQLAWSTVAEAIGLESGEQVVIGVGPSSLLSAGTGCPRARCVMGRGINGADLALIEVLREERIADRFTEVVIVSGDGAFAEVAAWLGSSGVSVTVVARAGTLSSRLRLAANQIILLSGQGPTYGLAA